MSIPAFNVAMLLAGAPINPGGAEPATPVLLAASGRMVQTVASPATPAAATDVPMSPAQPESPPLTAAPVSEPPAAPLPEPGTGQYDIVVTAPERWSGDPLEDVNAKSFEATRVVDEAVIGPVARAYGHAVPRPIRSGLRNFLHNLHEPVVALNFLLQLKPGKAVETVGRFAINSTIGGAGLFDVAKRRPFNLPRRANGFADTLGYYGVKPGPYLFLPLIGPTTPRDLLGLVVDRMVVPMAVGKLPSSVGRPLHRLARPLAIAKVLDHRAEFDEQLQDLRETANPYAARREFYLQRRQAEIDNLRGHRRVAGPGASELTNPAMNPLPEPALRAQSQAASPGTMPGPVSGAATSPNAPALDRRLGRDPDPGR
jgi:ABC-type transporter lipoprotein component MlaA